MKKSTAVGLAIGGGLLVWAGLSHAKKAQAPAPRPSPPAPPRPPAPPAPAKPPAPPKPAAPLAVSPPPPPVVFKADPVVLWVQKAFNADTRLTGRPRLAEDGNWGPQTSQGVKQLQQDLGVAATGTLTEELLAAIDASDIPGDPRPMGPPPPTTAL